MTQMQVIQKQNGIANLGNVLNWSDVSRFEILSGVTFQLHILGHIIQPEFLVLHGTWHITNIYNILFFHVVPNPASSSWGAFFFFFE